MTRAHETDGTHGANEVKTPGRSGWTRRRLAAQGARWLSSVGLLSGAVALASCEMPGAAGTTGTAGTAGTTAQQPAGASAAKSQAPVTLTYLHQWSPTQGHGPMTDKLVARFNEQFPAIQISPSFIPGGQYYDKLAAMIAGGDLPDVVTYNLAFLPLLVKKNVLVPAQDLAKGALQLNLNDMVPSGRAMATFNGKLMTVPYVLNSSGLALNTSLYEQNGLDPTKPPSTWQELVSQAQQLTSHNGKDIWGTVFPRGTADSISPLVAFIWQNGGDLVDEKRLEPVWNSAAAVEALQFQVDLVHRYGVADFPNPANGEQGNVGIWHIPPGNVSAIPLRIKDAFKWTTAELPKGKQAATTVGGHSLGVLKTGKYESQAWQFVHWYVQPATNAEYLVGTTTLPPWHASEQNATWQQYVKEEPRITPFVKMLSYARPSPKLSHWEEIVAMLVDARDAAAKQEKTPQQALDDAARLATPLIKEG